MANRVVAEDVSAILDDTNLTDPQIEIYITGANAFVSNVLGTTLGIAVLKEIERYLSAHFISISRERIAKKEEAGGAKIEYTGTYGGGLRATHYGQTAINFDTTGVLEEQAGGIKEASSKAIPGYSSNR